MVVTYNIDDSLCPCCETKWIRLKSSLFYGDCYFCEDCDKIYEPSIKEVTREWLAENYTPKRFEEIKARALLEKARLRVTREDLIRLGYLKTEKNE